MSLYTYNYSIKNDIIVGKVDIGSLYKEICDSDSIVVAIKDISTKDDDLSITFKSEVTNKSDLDSIVELHSGKPSVEGNVYDTSGIMYVHPTSKPYVFNSYWTGRGDDLNDPTVYGSGRLCRYKHKTSTNKKARTYIDFSCVENRTFLHEIYFSWKDAVMDTISVDLVSMAVNWTSSTNTDYTTASGNLIVPADKDGNVEITSDITLPNGGLVYMPLGDDGKRSAAFWNADWNHSTERFENITAAPNGDGTYNMFSEETNLYRIVNKLYLLGDGSQLLNSTDPIELGHGMRLKFKMNTETDSSIADHDWHASWCISLYREKTI